MRNILYLFLLCLSVAEAQSDLGALVQRVREIKRQAPSCPDGQCVKEMATTFGMGEAKRRVVPSRVVAEEEWSGKSGPRAATIPNARMGRQTLNSIWNGMSQIGETTALALCQGSTRTTASTTEYLRWSLERARPHLQNINRAGIVTFDLGLFQGVLDRMNQRTGDEIVEDVLGLYAQYAGQLTSANLACCQLNDGPVLPAPIIPNLANAAVSIGITGGVYSCLECSSKVDAAFMTLHNEVLVDAARDLQAVQGCMTGVEVGSLLRPLQPTSENQGAFLSYVYTVRDVSLALLANDCVCDLSSRVLVAPPPQTLSGTIVGRVISAATQAPLSGATVAVGSGTSSVRTAADGTYRLAGIAPGNVALTASASGFLSASRSVTLPAEGQVAVDFALTTAPVATGTLSGFVRNAATGSPISGVRISLSNSPLTDTSAVNGAFRIPGAPVGNTIVTASMAGFAPSTFSATVTADGTTILNLSISPVLDAGQVRITLNWQRNANDQPRDLDMHLYGPREGTTSCFYINFGNPGFLNASPFAQLEVDNIAVSGVPPTETIRISRLIPGTYTLFIDNYSGGANVLAQSQAQIAVFRENRQVATYTVPTGSPEVWHVLNLDGTTGQITVVNQLRTTFPPQACR